MDIRSFFGNKPANQQSSAADCKKKAAPNIKTATASDVVDSSDGHKENIAGRTDESVVPNAATNAAELDCKPVGIIPLPDDLKNFVTWQPGEAVPYFALVRTFDEVSHVSGRIDKENLFEKLFRAVLLTSPGDLDVLVYLASNQVSPVYDGLELGIGDSLLVKAVCEATGRKREAVQEDYEKEGDLGTVALMSRANQKTLSFASKPKPLSARWVLDQFRAITITKGDKAQGRKVDVVKSMMVKCQGSEAKYIVRSLQGKLRIGIAQQTVLVSLAHAVLSVQEGWITGGAGAGDVVMTAIEQDAETSHQNGEKGQEEGVPKEEEGEGSLDGSEDEGLAIVDDDGDVSAAVGIDVLNDIASPTVTDLLSHVLAKETPEATKLRVHFLSLYASMTHRTSRSGSTKSSSSSSSSSSRLQLSREDRQQLAEIAVKRAFSECPNLSILVLNLLDRPLYALHKHSCLSIGVPVAPMLAKPTKQITDVLKRLSGLAFTMEYKYDGERAQVHLLPDGTVKIFSRNSEDNSEKYPDLRDTVRRARVPEVVSCILDAEVVAYDREQKCLLPFQVLSTRKRKVEAGEEDTQKVKVILQIFDLLYLNGQSLLREPLRARRLLMQRSFTHCEGMLHFASGLDHVEDGDTTPIESFLQEACAAQCEGLMVKTLDHNASYEPSKRSLNWLKLKKDYIDGMGVCDSVDLVVLGGYLGRGKRVNTYGAYLMACYDVEKDEYQSVCKVGTGFKDEDLSRLYARMQNHLLPSHRRPANYNVSDVLTPDHWFEACQVWELQAADLSKSSVHKGGIGRLDMSGDRSMSRGIGLRFPRFLREREDKKAEAATTSEQIVEMFYGQGIVGEDGGGGNNNGEDNADDDEWL